MGFACAGAVNPLAMRFLRFIEAAITGSVIAARLAVSEDGTSNCEQRADATKQRTQEDWLIAAVSVRTADVTAKPA